ncbi:galactose-1-phosphate uridylyltransferase, partial [Streptomyces sp. SID10244]|nr:galactose-1-phosphate uridylyltransferase [Streptomyces sp. SID10244]
GSFSGLTPERARLVVDVWSQRTDDLLARDGVEEVFCFENRGEEIGVTLTHPHGQIYAYPFRTHRTETMLRAASTHRAQT